MMVRSGYVLMSMASVTRGTHANHVFIHVLKYYDHVEVTQPLTGLGRRSPQLVGESSHLLPALWARQQDNQ